MINGMKLVKTEEAEGYVLCHDMTQIIPGEFKGARFKKGHVVAKEDIPVLLSMGKENLYVLTLGDGFVHEEDAAMRLCALCENEGMRRGEISEGKIELFAEHKGLLQVDAERLNSVNAVKDVMIATKRGNSAVMEGEKLCGMRVIPLVVEEACLQAAEEAAGNRPLLTLLPYSIKTAAILATGSEVKKGLIQDQFTPAVEQKLAAYGIEVTVKELTGDDPGVIADAIAYARKQGVDFICVTGGMSVDPDDNTPGAIKKSGADIVTYGAPVLPGAMFLLGYFEDGVPIVGLPGCVMFMGRTVFDLVLPRIAAGVRLKREDIVALGEGGLL